MKSIVMNVDILIVIALLSGVAVGQGSQPSTPDQNSTGSTHVQVKASPSQPSSKTAKSPFMPKTSNAQVSSKTHVASKDKSQTQNAGNGKSVKPSAQTVAVKQPAAPAKKNAPVAKAVSIPVQGLKNSKPVAANGPAPKGSATAPRSVAASASGKAAPSSQATAHAKPAVIVPKKNAGSGAKPLNAKAAPAAPVAKPAKSLEVKNAVKPPIVAAKPVSPETAPAPPAAAAVIHKVYGLGRRDPFVSPIHKGMQGGVAGNCVTGKRCLDIEQVVLKGIVRTREGNMALVENASKRPYVLRENDALFNGTVERITGDSVFFRQNTSDMLGHTSTREVVKKVSAPSV